MKRRGLPDNIPKRGLHRFEAAEYVGLSPNSFDAAVREGVFPAPYSIGKRKIWDRHILDRSLDVLGGLRDPLIDDIDLDKELGLGVGAAS